VLSTLDRLARDDPSVDVKRIVGTENLRLRVGDWRVVFRLTDPQGPIVVGRILPRGRAYQR
jgi:mRNA-degrading endonuclease RelE of RelBE toxin-antitoxin system